MMAAFGLGRRRGTHPESGDTTQGTTLPPEGAATFPTYSRETAPAWLAAVSTLPEVLAYKAHSYELLKLEPGMTLLDVGCGVGNDARALAPLLAPTGRVVAVDADPQMIAAAESQQVSDVPSPVPIQFLCSSAERLPIEDMTVDVVRMDRVLQHVPSPQRVLAEIQRVLRPDARVVLVEPDWGMVAIYPASAAGGDDDTMLAAVLSRAVASVPHPLIGRRLRALLREAGYEDILIDPVAYSTARLEVADLGLELSATVDAIGADDPVAGEAAHAWLAAARAADHAGDFFASVPLIFACAAKRA